MVFRHAPIPRKGSGKQQQQQQQQQQELVGPALLEADTDEPLLKSAISLFFAFNLDAAILSCSSVFAISRGCFCLASASAFGKACLASSSARLLSNLTFRAIKVLLDVTLTLSATCDKLSYGLTLIVPSSS